MRRFLILASLALLACGGGTEPEAVSFVGTYSLLSAGGRTIPFTDGEAGFDQREYLSGALELRAAGRYTESWHTRAFNTSTGRNEVDDRSYHGTYAVRGDTVHMESDEDSWWRPQARFVNGQLRVRDCLHGECGDWDRVYVKQ